MKHPKKQTFRTYLFFLLSLVLVYSCDTPKNGTHVTAGESNRICDCPLQGLPTSMLDSTVSNEERSKNEINIDVRASTKIKKIIDAELSTGYKNGVKEVETSKIVKKIENEFPEHQNELFWLRVQQDFYCAFYLNLCRDHSVSSSDLRITSNKKLEEIKLAIEKLISFVNPITEPISSPKGNSGNRKTTIRQPKEKTIPIILDKSFKGDYAVVVVKNSSSVNQILGNKIARVLSTKYSASASLFHNNFVSENYFQKIYKGSFSNIRNLGISKFAKFLLLIRETSNVNEDDEFGQTTNIVSVKISLRVINTVTGNVVISEVFETVGNDTDDGIAYSKAIDSLLKKIKTIDFP